MNAKNILAGGFIGGIALFAVNFVVSAIILAVAPYDILALGGMRAAEDPLLVFFFAYPFVLSFAAAIIYDLVQGSLQGTPSGRGATFGAGLVLLYTVPSLFITFTSMNYPAGFYFENLLFGLVGFPLIGVIYAMLWERL
ncbi:hypothetical protein FGU65_12950 [Methanoculleus sp. FWC-SCC1]|uniref:Uncharacterized protein n=1 Tax=Methanoculleus frigidifontis TaxID=2584085 RepID=A0ABT8MCX0_9EURY|nr:hypothetical protein [Methanoculleus sp. FWC-SCC1]MDN7025776.1 hypothetical protein [Methanoculleus sp. FWC-SCC1]